MTYAQRNNLTILAVLILLVSISLFWYRSESKTLEKVKKQNKELNMKLNGKLEISDTFGQFTTERDSLISRFQKFPKKLVNAEEPAFSLRYINWLIQKHNLNIDFDFFLNSKSQGKRYTTFRYTLKGESDYQNFCSLIWYITNYPILYKIKNASLKKNSDNARNLKFSMVLEGYSVPDGWKEKGKFNFASLSFSWLNEFRHNAFLSALPKKIKIRPVVRKRILPEEPPGLLDAEKSQLIAVANRQIYVKDRQGKMISLKLGDRVKRGNLVQIDQAGNRAIFRIRTLAGNKIVILKLRYN